jgi:hypothetical protein
MCVQSCFLDIYFFSKTEPWSPSGVSQKINFIETSLSLFCFMPIRVLIIFCTLWTFFPLVRWLFYGIDFLTDLWGGPGFSFWAKINVEKTTLNTHKATQFFILIPDMLLVSTQVPFARVKSAKYQSKI